MELQFSGKMCEYLQSVVWENKLEELTQEIRLSDGMADVGTILGTWGQILIRSKEWRDKQMSISGGVTAWTVYLPENGGMPETLEVWMPFHLKWELPENDRDGTILVSCAVRSMDARSVSSRRIMLRCVISVIGEGMLPAQLEVFTPCDIPEDVHLLSRSHCTRLPKEAGEKVFVLDEEFDLSAGADDVCKLVRCCVHPEITDKKVMADKAVFRGSAVVDMLCLCQRGNLIRQSFEIPFSQFAELSAQYGPDATPWMSVALTSVEPELMEDKTVRLKVGLIGQYAIHDTVQLEVVEDAYSTLRDIKLQCRELAVPSILEEKQEVMKAEQTTDDIGILPVDVELMLSQPEIYRENSTDSIEVNGMFRMVYTDAENELHGKTATWKNSMDIPATEEAKVLAWARKTGKPQFVQTAESALLKQDIVVDRRTVSKRSIPMITALSLGDMKESNEGTPSLILCRPGKDSLWEIAKRYGSTVDAICQLNGITEETIKGKMLLIPISQ